MEPRTSSPRRVYATQRPFGDQSPQNALTSPCGLVRRNSPLPFGRTVNKSRVPVFRWKTIRPFSPLKVADAGGGMTRTASAANRPAAQEAEKAFIRSESCNCVLDNFKTSLSDEEFELILSNLR